MIAIKLRAGLGNNLFQYAAARSLAESRGYDFCYFPLRTTNYYWRAFRKGLNRLRRRDSSPMRKQIAQADIGRYFTLGDERWLRQFMLRAAWSVTTGSRKRRFSPRRKTVSDRYDYEIFDDQVFDVGDWTELSGAFQSEAYFADNRERVQDWFKLRPRYAARLERLEQSWPAPVEKRCCIHVRRGDQLLHDKGLAWNNQGWALPLSYYQAAVERLPRDLFYVIATDSPDYVRENFGFIGKLHICVDNPEPIDISLFGLCKYNIVANSTFSWWGAWLSRIEDKVVIAPEYHMGWSKRKWIPWSFEHHPRDWTYIDVLDLVEGNN